MRAMRNALLFIAGATLAITCAAILADEPAVDITVEQYLSVADGETERAQRAQFYAYGLFSGSYIMYVQSLIAGGLKHKTAYDLAGRQCGDLTLDTVTRILRATKEAYEAPLRIAIPLTVDTVCRRLDTRS